MLYWVHAVFPPNIKYGKQKGFKPFIQTKYTKHIVLSFCACNLYLMHLQHPADARIQSNFHFFYLYSYAFED